MKYYLFTLSLLISFFTIGQSSPAALFDYDLNKNKSLLCGDSLVYSIPQLQGYENFASHLLGLQIRKDTLTANIVLKENKGLEMDTTVYLNEIIPSPSFMTGAHTYYKLLFVYYDDLGNLIDSSDVVRVDPYKSCIEVNTSCDEVVFAVNYMAPVCPHLYHNWHLITSQIDNEVIDLVFYDSVEYSQVVCLAEGVEKMTLTLKVDVSDLSGDYTLRVNEIEDIVCITTPCPRYDTTTFEEKINIPTCVVNDKIELSESSIIYPNPTDGLVQFNEKTSYELRSINGDLLLNGNDDKIDISSFENGVYLLQINDKIVKLLKE